MEATNELVQKFHPDKKGQDLEELEDENARALADYNEEGYKYREFRAALRQSRAGGVGQRKQAKAGKSVGSPNLSR